MAKTGPKPGNNKAQKSVFEQDVGDSYNFDESVIEGRRYDDIDEYRKGKLPLPPFPYNPLTFKTRDFFDPDNPESTTQKVLSPLFKLIQSSMKFDRIEDSYANNFIVNLHNYNFPVPIPLQMFITSIELTNTKDSPYQSASMTLQLPVSIATGLFSGPSGHPEPGQWLIIRHRPNDPNNSPYDSIFGASAGMAMDNLQFIGTITGIDYEITTSSEGNSVCSISVLANSFIHNLMYAEYKVKPTGMRDQLISEIEGEEETFIVGATAESSSYMINWPDWYALIQQESQAASGKVSLRKSLRLLTDALAYPQLPPSVNLEPMDLASFLNVYAGSNFSLEELIGRLALIVPPKILEFYFNGILSVYEILAIDSPVVNYTQIKTAAAAYYAEKISDDNNIFGVDDSTEEIEIFKRYLEDPTFFDAKGGVLKISSIVHIATTRDHIPPSHPMWGCMPHDDIPFVDINRIKNVNMETTTVWDLMQGTFQTDSNIIEFFPTILSVSARDLAYYKQQNIEVRRIHRLLGGIPTLILRMKPMHPMMGKHGISKRTIDFATKKGRTSLGASNFNVNPELQYHTASEKMKDVLNGRKLSEYKDCSYGEALPYYVDPQISSEHPDYIRAYSLPPQVYQDEIIRMSYGLNDRARVNSVKVINPQTKNMGSKLRYAIDGDAIQNVESAVRHGLRSYDPVWPYNEFRSAPTSKPEASEAPNYKMLNTHLSERCYLIMGDDQKYFAGTLVAMSLIDKGITPGQWVEVFLGGGNNVDIYAKESMLIYVESIAYDYDVRQSDGLITMRTIIDFTRGSMGAQIPDFPYFKGPHLKVDLTEGDDFDNDVDDYNFDDEDNGRPVGTQEKIVPEIEPIVRQESITEQALRHYAISKIQQGQMTPSEGKDLIDSGNPDGIPKDDMALFNAVKTRFAMDQALVDTLMDQDGTQE